MNLVPEIDSIGSQFTPGIALLLFNNFLQIQYYLQQHHVYEAFIFKTRTQNLYTLRNNTYLTSNIFFSA